MDTSPYSQPSDDSKAAAEKPPSKGVLHPGEEHFRLLVEASPNALIMSDRHGIITLLNRQAERLFGYSREELMGASVDLLVPERFREQHRMMRRRFMGEPAQRPMGSGRDLWALRKDGSELPVEIGLAPIETPDGLYVLSTLTDISWRKEADEALRQSEDRFRTLAEAMPQIVWMATAEGAIDYANRRWYEYTGLMPDSEWQWDWERAVHPDDLVGTKDGWSRMLLIRQPAEMEYRLRRTDGACRWHLCRWRPLYNAKGDLIRWIGTATDVDDLKRAQEDLEKLADELRRSNRDLEEFASMVSHDLQQPLVVAAGYLRLLKRSSGEKLDAESRQYINIAYESALQMQEMIRGMLDYARVGHGNKPFAPADLEEVLQQVLRTLREETKRCGATIVHDTLPTLNGDRKQLEQVLQNLLSNALKFRSADRDPSIHVQASRAPEGWLLCVRDNGIGIDPAHTQLIFELFQRLDPDGTYPGAGLGLAICKKIVERHGGRIWVESQAGQGSAFYFTLPDRTASHTPGI